MIASASREARIYERRQRGERGAAGRAGEGGGAGGMTERWGGGTATGAGDGGRRARARSLIKAAAARGPITLPYLYPVAPQLSRLPARARAGLARAFVLGRPSTPERFFVLWPSAERRLERRFFRCCVVPPRRRFRRFSASLSPWGNPGRSSKTRNSQGESRICTRVVLELHVEAREMYVRVYGGYEVPRPSRSAAHRS